MDGGTVVEGSGFAKWLATGSVVQDSSYNDILVSDTVLNKIFVWTWDDSANGEEGGFVQNLNTIDEPKGDSTQGFGAEFRIRANILYVGNRGADGVNSREKTVLNAGGVYLFSIPRDLTQPIDPDTPFLTLNQRNQLFGTHVEVGDFLANGNEDVLAYPSSGGVLTIFDGSPLSPYQSTSELEIEDGPINDTVAVALDGDGADFFAERPGGVWIWVNGRGSPIEGCADYLLIPPDGIPARFGWGMDGVAPDDGGNPGILVVGEPDRESDGSGLPEGHIYVYTYALPSSP